MRKAIYVLVIVLSYNTAVMAQEVAENRYMVEMPPQMKQIFLSKMRDHMEALDKIIAALAEDDLNEAAEIAENTMGIMGAGQGKKMQSNKHDQSAHKKKGFGKLMPPGMKAMGMSLHKAADDFADIARQGNRGEAYEALQKISSSCVACHQSFGVK